MADKWFDKDIMNSIEREFSDRLDLAADVTVGEIITRTPVKKGFLKGNTKWKKVGKFIRRVFNNTEYALDVEFGTKPHIIKAKNKKVLAFDMKVGSDLKSGKALYRNKKTGKLQKTKSKNTKVFATKVKHPGTPAQPFFRPGYRAAYPKIKKLMGQ